ncbi:Armadillo-like helical domain containing protein [Gracilaria domingensis]|nr:Armadillo-like helical domain containing protein [Gracilaria domingensis]
MASKQVKQSTFDAIVREGVQEFGLSAEEAVADACEQLRKSGITDLSNLDVSIPSEESSENQASQSHVNAVRDALQSDNPSSVTDTLSTLQSNVRDKRDVASAVSNGVIELLAQCMEYSLKLPSNQKLGVVRPLSELMVTLCAKDELNRSTFVKLANGLGNMKLVFNSLADQEQEGSSFFDFETCATVVQAMCSIQRGSEHVKQCFAANDSLDCLIKYFENACRGIIENGNVVSSAVKLFIKLSFFTRQLLSPDDATVKVSETFNRARILAGGNTVTESGLRPLLTSSNLLELFSALMAQVQASSSFSKATKRHIQTECIACIRTCCVSDEICSQIIKLDLHKSCIELLQQFRSDENTVNVCVGLLRNLAGRDECKTPIYGSMAVLTEVVTPQLGASSKICEQYCGLLGSLCLRRPDIANKIVKTGMINAVLDAMEIYDDDTKVQRIGCLAIRNVCARDMEARRHLRQKGLAEKLIRKAWKRHNNCDDVAYAALRDMDVLEDRELRRDERYTMPTGFYNTPIVREKDV